jgi:hypothetical protein
MNPDLVAEMKVGFGSEEYFLGILALNLIIPHGY